MAPWRKGSSGGDALHPVAELDAAGKVVATFTYGEKENVPSIMSKAGTDYRIISDHLGSVRMVVNNNNGAILQQLDYDPYGRVIVDTNPGFQPFGYAGGLYDRDTGLVRFGRRDYDPVVGRWTSKDPIGFAGGLNLYGYVVQDPVNLVDPDGRNPLILAAAAYGIFEVGSSLYDVYSMAEVSVDPNATLIERGLTAGGFALGIIAPGPGTADVQGGRAALRTTTDFVEGAQIIHQGRRLCEGTVDLRRTFDRIKKGIRYPHRNDGTEFMNKENLLPAKPATYYTEYVHPTAGLNGPGPQRIVVGANGEAYYTPDHYVTFTPVR